MIWRGHFLAFATFALASPALAQVRCLPDRDTPSLDASFFAKARFYTLEWDVSNGPDRDPTTYHPGIGEVTLKSGVNLEVLTTGCHEHGNSYTFFVQPNEHPPSDQPYWLDRAASLLSEIAPANLDRQMPFQPLIDLLRSRAAELRVSGPVDPQTLFGTLRDGQANNRWSFWVEPYADKMRLGVTYTFEP